MSYLDMCLQDREARIGHRNRPKKFPVVTVLVERIESACPYLIGGVVQEVGDRSRMPKYAALDLVFRGKAKIVEGSESTEML